MPSGEPYAAIAHGKYEFSTTDLSLPGPMPLELTRTYRSQYKGGNGVWLTMPFGTGMNFNYDLWLSSESLQAGRGYRDIDFIYPDGQEVFCGRTNSCSKSGCTDYTDATFACTSNPDPAFYGATIVYNAAIRPSGGWSLTRKDGTVYAFPSGAPASSITDRYENAVTITWRTASTNAQYVPTRIDDSNGRWITFGYGSPQSPDLVSSATDSGGRTVTYTYDSSLRLTSVISPNGTSWSTAYSYVNQGDISQVAVLGASLTSIAYDSSNHVKSISAPVNSFSLAYTLNANGGITAATVTDPNGHIEKLTFDGNHYLTSNVRAKGLPEQQTNTYLRNTSTDELITQVTDQLNRQTCYSYDQLGNVTGVIFMCGTSSAASWSYAYDPSFSRLQRITDPLGHSTTLAIDGDGNAVSLTDALGNVTTAGYNAQGQETSLTDPANNRTLFGYDSYGNLTSVTEPMGENFSVGYDSAGRETSITDPMGGVTSLGYDPVGNLTSSTDANGKKTIWQYGNGNIPFGSIDPLGYFISYDYGTSSINVTYPNSELTYNFDGVGNITSTVDGRGLTTSYTYDGLNRLVLTHFNSTGVPGYSQTTSSFSYDGGNRLLTAQGAGNTVARTYDGLDDLLSDGYSSGSLNATVSYTYDAARRRTAMTASNQPQTSYLYDIANRLTSITQGATTISLGYDADGRTTNISLPNSLAQIFTYDHDSRVIAISNGSAGNLTYGYDSNSRVVDVGGSLSAVTIPSPVSASYQKLAISSWNGVTATYDDNGNLLADPSNHGSYTWNEQNQLATATGNGNTLSFGYDALGRRMSQTVNSSLTGYVWDGLNIVQEQVSTGNANMISMPNSVDQNSVGAQAPWMLANLSFGVWAPPGSSPAEALAGPGINGYLTRTQSGTTWTVLQDGLGSSTALVSGTGSRNYSYAPFGATTGSGAATSNPYQFTGSQLDANGVYYMNARYYSPALQRFISPDPLGLTAGTPNIYMYGANSPTNLIGPTGLFCGEFLQKVKDLIQTLQNMAQTIGGLVEVTTVTVGGPGEGNGHSATAVGGSVHFARPRSNNTAAAELVASAVLRGQAPGVLSIAQKRVPMPPQLSAGY